MTPKSAITIPAAYILVFSAVAVVLFAALLETLTHFAPYDDSGFMMRCTAFFLDGRILYDEIDNPYGPSYYLLQWVEYGPVVKIPLDHNHVKLTGQVWLALTALALALATRLLLQSSGLAVTAFLLTYMVLSGPAARGSGHPQELIGIVTALTCCAIAWYAKGKELLPSACLGILIATALLCKVNIGVYLATALVVGITAGRGMLPRFLATLPVLLLGSLPSLLLFASHSDKLGRTHLEWVTITGVASLAVTLWSSGLRATGLSYDWRPAAMNLVACGVSTFVAVAVIYLFALAHGCTPSGLYRSLILNPSRYLDGSWTGTMSLPRDMKIALFMSFAMSCLCSILTSRTTVAANGLRISLPCLFFISCAFGYVKLPLSLVPAFAWLAVLPSCSSTPFHSPGWQARLLLALLVTLLPLQAYPIAGDQFYHGHLLAVVLVLVVAYDGTQEVGGALGESWRQSRAALVGALPVASWIALMVPYATQLPALYAIHAERLPLACAGASLLRPPEAQTAQYEFLTAELTQESDSFLCQAGLNSLHLWTKVPSPDSVIVGNGYFCMAAEVQARIAAALAATRHPVVLLLRPKHAYLNEPKPSWLEERVRSMLAPAAFCRDFDIWVRSAGVPLELHACVSKDISSTPESGWILDIPECEQGESVTRLELFDLTASRSLCDSMNGQIVTADKGENSVLPISLPFRSEIRMGLQTSPDLGHDLVMRLFDSTGKHFRSLPVVGFSSKAAGVASVGRRADWATVP